MKAGWGWTGKLPSKGDFLTRRVPAEFGEPWQRWLDGVLVGSRAILREAWVPRFLSAPAWRFVLAPGVLSARAWAGIMVPSVDSVGRHYPLTLVYALHSMPFDPERTLEALADWLDTTGSVATEALASGSDPEALDARVVALAAPPALRCEAAGSGPLRSAWSARGSEFVPGWRFSVHGMPDAARYCEMLAGAVRREAAMP